MPSTPQLDQAERLTGVIDPAMPVLSARDLFDGEWSRVVDPIRTCVRAHGFLCVDLTGHHRVLTTSLLVQMERFFALDAATKARVRDPGGHYGWTPSSAEPAYQPGTSSNVESYDLERPLIDNLADPFWPVQPGFQTAALDGWRAYLALADALLEAIARAVDLRPDFLTSQCRTRELNTMRLLHYPAHTAPLTSEQVGIAAHTDFECITLLYQTRPGLELRTPDGRWLDAPTQAGRLIVLFDDMLERWTNGAVLATGHRVRRTRDARYSIVTFVAVDPGVPVGPQPAFVSAERPAAYPATEQGRHISDEMARARMYAGRDRKTDPTDR